MSDYSNINSGVLPSSDLEEEDGVEATINDYLQSGTQDNHLHNLEPCIPQLENCDPEDPLKKKIRKIYRRNDETQKQRNREAQRRYRERQKSIIMSLKLKVQELQKTIFELEETNTLLQREVRRFQPYQRRLQTENDDLRTKLALQTDEPFYSVLPPIFWK